MTNYWASIKRLAESHGFSRTIGSGDSWVYRRLDEQQNIQELIFARARARKKEDVDITLKIWFTYRAVLNIEEEAFGTSYTRKHSCDADLEMWRIDKNVDRMRGITIPKESPEHSTAWSVLIESMDLAVKELSRPPEIARILEHLTAGLKTVHDPGSIWPWMPSGSRRPLYFLVLGRVKEAKEWADNFCDGLSSRPDDQNIKYAMDQEKTWAKMLHEGTARI
jgi:hypothetical protein